VKLWAKTFFGRLGLYLYLRLGIYGFWSRIYRLLYCGFAKGTRLPVFKSVEEVLPYLRGMKYGSDSWFELFDAIASPEAIWFRYINGVDSTKLGNDCDEFACWLTNTVRASLADHRWEDSVWSPGILTVCWIDAEGHYGGHNVCLLKSTVTGSYQYWDYGYPSKFFDTMAEVATEVRRAYAGAGNIDLGWGLMDADLRVLTAKRGQ
jgi:hypothetical protein